jgi:hypothetical protein
MKHQNKLNISRLVMSATKAFAFLSFVLPLACLRPDAASAAWIVSVDQRNGLPVASRGGATVMSSEFALWGKDWLWAGPSTDVRVVAPFDYAISGKSPSLNIDIAGRVKKSSSRQLTWDFDLNARTTSTGVMGGGVVFKLDLEKFGAELGEPELLPGNRGWRLGRPGATQLEMRFDPPMASVYFERGHKSEIRAFFYAGEIPEGQRHYVVSLDISGDAAIGPSTPERFGLDDPAQWPRDLVDWNRSPVDLSFLNDAEKPAGKHGFVRVVKGRMQFEDGAPARFWGTNITASALFNTPRNAVKLQARRLSELGFNLVRLHHHDSSWVTPNVFGNQAGPDTGNLSEAMMEKLDWWIKCLKEEGIYVWLDLHVGRQLKAGDNIDDFDEIAKGRPTADLKGYNYVNASIQRAMQRFDEAYVDHLNVFTGLRHREEPAIVAMLLTNENDLTNHFGNGLLPDKNVPRHDAIYMSEANAFAARYALPRDKTWRAWEHGPSKFFLNDLEHEFDASMIDRLRALGVKVPIVTTSSWGNNPLSSLPALTTGDMVDAHSYGGTDELEKNPLYAPNLIDWIAAAHVAGRPLTSTEWNVEAFPVPDRHAIPLYVACAARLQGWDALMQYAYSQAPFTGIGSPSNWEAFNDPGLLATLPAAALLYRRGDVLEARTTYVFAPTPDQLFNRVISPANSVALRTATEKGKLLIAMPQTQELPWLETSQAPAGATVMTDPNRPLIDGKASEAVSDTGELRRNWDQGVYTIDTPRTQAATGWIGGKAIELADVEIAAATRNATIAVQSLDGKAISEAHAITISLGARSLPEPGNRMPFHSEPVTGHLTIRAVPGLSLYRQRVVGRENEAIAIPYDSGRYEIDLGNEAIDHWLVLR